MNELQRMLYTQAMGIDCYVPRWVLPAAPEATLCTLPVAEEVSVLTSHTESVGSEPLKNVGADSYSGDIKSALDILNDKAPVKKEVAEASIVATDIVPVKANVSEKPIEPFALSVWCVSDELLVIDSRHSDLALPTELFLFNVLKAFSLVKETLVPLEVIQWPLVENAVQLLDFDESREMVMTYLGSKYSQALPEKTLVMGKEAIGFIAQKPDWQEHVYQRVEAEGFDSSLLLLPSLSEILITPSDKPLLYQSLLSYL